MVYCYFDIGRYQKLCGGPEIIHLGWAKETNWIIRAYLFSPVFI